MGRKQTLAGFLWCDIRPRCSDDPKSHPKCDFANKPFGAPVEIRFAL